MYYEHLNQDTIDEKCLNYLVDKYKDKSLKDIMKDMLSTYDFQDQVEEEIEDDLYRLEKEAEEKAQYDYEYNQKHYNDGWSDHIGV